MKILFAILFTLSANVCFSQNIILGRSTNDTILTNVFAQNGSASNTVTGLNAYSPIRFLYSLMPTGTLTNGNIYVGTNAFVQTNAIQALTNAALQAAIVAGGQPASANLTNWSLHATNDYLGTVGGAATNLTATNLNAYYPNFSRAIQTAVGGVSIFGTNNISQIQLKSTGNDFKGPDGGFVGLKIHTNFIGINDPLTGNQIIAITNSRIDLISHDLIRVHDFYASGDEIDIYNFSGTPVAYFSGDTSGVHTPWTMGADINAPFLVPGTNSGIQYMMTVYDGDPAGLLSRSGITITGGSGTNLNIPGVAVVGGISNTGTFYTTNANTRATFAGTNGSAAINSDGNFKVATNGTPTEVSFGAAGIKTNGFLIDSSNSVSLVNNGARVLTATNGATAITGNVTVSGGITGTNIFPGATQGFIIGVGTGTNAVFQATTNLLQFGTTQPQITIPAAGTWEITASSQVLMNNVNANAGTNSMSVYRNNNTPAFVGTFVFSTRNAITATADFVPLTIVPFLYTTVNANDVLELRGAFVPALNSGTFEAHHTWIRARRVY